jgi:hypothetical protein
LVGVYLQNFCDFLELLQFNNFFFSIIVHLCKPVKNSLSDFECKLLFLQLIHFVHIQAKLVFVNLWLVIGEIFHQLNQQIFISSLGLSCWISWVIHFACHPAKELKWNFIIVMIVESQSSENLFGSYIFFVHLYFICIIRW